MTYHRRHLSGLGGVESCGANQVWDPNVTFNGIKGQCMPRSNYAASDLVDPSASPGVVKDKSSGFNWGGLLQAFVQPAAPAPAPTVIVQQAPGMSTTTKIAIAGGAALLLVVLATRN